MQNIVAPPHGSLNNLVICFGGSLYIYTALGKLPKSNSTLCEIHDRVDDETCEACKMVVEVLEDYIVSGVAESILDDVDDICGNLEEA